MPSEVSGKLGFFDRFAEWAAQIASRTFFFAFCVLLIIVWVPTFVLFKFDTWQLIINTATTIITFLMVALLQNSQVRQDQATQHKLNALAKGLADLMDYVSKHDRGLTRDIEEPKLAVGLEELESTTHNAKAG